MGSDLFSDDLKYFCFLQSLLRLPVDVTILAFSKTAKFSTNKSPKSNGITSINTTNLKKSNQDLVKVHKKIINIYSWILVENHLFLFSMIVKETFCHFGKIKQIKLKYCNRLVYMYRNKNFHKMPVQHIFCKKNNI